MPELPKRKLQRLREYDYTQNGAYFLTICAYNGGNLFGTIDNGIVHLHPAGHMVSQTLSEMPPFYPHIHLDAFIVMPNHLHAIVWIAHTGTETGTGTQTETESATAMSIPAYMHRFKSLTTNRYIEGVKQGNYPAFDHRVWQKSYHDHIIRNEQDYQRIGEYINTNASKWREDCFYNGGSE